MPMLTDADLVPAPSAAEVAWTASCNDLRRAQLGLLRLQCPTLLDTHLDAVAGATTATAVTPLEGRPHGERMAELARLVDETRQRCRAIAARASTRRDGDSSQASRSRSASAERSDG